MLATLVGAGTRNGAGAAAGGIGNACTNGRVAGLLVGRAEHTLGSGGGGSGYGSSARLLRDVSRPAAAVVAAPNLSAARRDRVSGSPAGSAPSELFAPFDMCSPPWTVRED